MALPHGDSEHLQTLTIPQGRVPESQTLLSTASDDEDNTYKVNGRGHDRHLQEDESGEDEEDQQGGEASVEEEEIEGEEEDGDDDDDDEEPALKYERITGAVPELLKKDSASALAVSHKFMVCLS